MQPSAAVQKPSKSALSTLAVIAVLIVFAAVALRTAWLPDRAYLTLRTIDNFVRGFGLTFNPGERVQAFTHPLWLLLLSIPYALTREAVLTTLITSLLVTLAALVVMARSRRDSVPAALVGVALLGVSRAFMDYAVSGLETPLVALLLAIFFALYFAPGEVSSRRLFWLALVAGLGALTRFSSLLLTVPVLVEAAFRLGGWKPALGAILLGFVPVFAWEAFSLVVYGSLLPTSITATLMAGSGSLIRVGDGLAYLWDSLRADPITLVGIVTGLVLAALSRDRRMITAGAGVLISLLAVVLTGGSAWSGFALAAPLFVAVILLTRADLMQCKEVWQFALVAAILIGLFAPAPTFFTGARYGVGAEDTSAGPVIDLRAEFYACTGLFRAEDEDAASRCTQAIAEGAEVATGRQMGMAAYAAGPGVHVIDTTGLADPLLARLPARLDPHLRPGLFDRSLPAGYIETVESGENVIRDSGIAAVYDDLALITRAPLFAPGRLAAVWRNVTGQVADPLGDRYFLADLAGQVTLTGWDAPLFITPGEAVTITTQWETSDRQPYDYYPYLYLFDGAGNWVSFGELETPLPVTGTPGEAVTGTHVLPLPDDLPVGVYGLAVGITPPGYAYSAEDGIWLMQLGGLKVMSPIPDNMTPATAIFNGEIALLGTVAVQDGQPVSLADAVPGPLALQLVWQAQTRPAGDYHVFVHVQNEGGIVSQSDAAPRDGAYPTNGWDAGEVVITEHTLDWPDSSEALQVFVGMYTWPDVVNVPAEQDGAVYEDGRLPLWP